MKDAEIIRRHREVKNQILLLTAELKTLEKDIIARALNRPHVPLTEAHREGRRATLSEDGEVLTVRFESDVLKASWAFDTPLTTQLQTTAGHRFDTLFRTKTTCERRLADGHKFRLHCHNELPEPAAIAVIELLKDKDKNGITKSKAVIE